MSMKNIQLDMFEVQLGAAILLQFRKNNSIVRVLSDAGVTAKGYATDHVHKKLRHAVNDFSYSEDKLRLDLIIGTHYDADHLKGLVPIIEDQSIEIGEAWMPPVANDTEITLNDISIKNHQLLAHQFNSEDAEKRLVKYLDFKKSVCEEVKQLQSDAREPLSKEQLNILRHSEEYSEINDSRNNVNSNLQEISSNIDEYLFKMHTNFLDYIQDPHSEVKDEDCSHADCEFDDEMYSSKDRAYLYDGFRQTFSSAQDRRVFFNRAWESEPYKESSLLSLAYIQRSAAKDAINAISLYEVVKALKKRNIPIVCQIIPDGKPRRFIWMETNKKFIPRAQLTDDDPELLLFGPSESLVKKHYHRLPIGEYISLAFRSIPIRSITPSNELSYVIRFEYEKQGILITGDAGFVDFKPKGKSFYHKDLINKLAPLHLIQIAHHGGNNAHFYRVLLSSDYPKQKANSLLLLSHATHDKFRPSKEFGYFVEEVLKGDCDIQLLFTSEPSLEKVKDFKDIIYPLKSSRDLFGDVQVVFDGQKWDVLKHAIAV